MKRNFFRFTITFLVFFVVVITGCKKNNQKPATPLIVGRWIIESQITSSNAQGSITKDTITYSPNTYNFFDFNQNGEGDFALDKTVTYLTWKTTTGNKLLLTYTGRVDTYDIVNLTQSTLELHALFTTNNVTTELTQTFKRAQRID